MFCDKCGNQLTDNEQFCQNCGAPTGAPANNTAGYNFAPATAPASNNLFSKITMGGSALMALGTFFPLYTVSVMGYSESVSYIQGDGIFVLILAIIAIVLTLMKKDKFTVIPIAIATLILLVATSQISEANSIASAYGAGKVGFGMYVLWIGAIAGLAGSIIPLVKKN